MLSTTSGPDLQKVQGSSSLAGFPAGVCREPGALRPARQLSPDEARAVASLDELEDALTERLQGEDKRLFLKFVDAYDEFLGSADLESFTCGFRLGAAFTYEPFVEKE